MTDLDPRTHARIQTLCEQGDALAAKGGVVIWRWEHCREARWNATCGREVRPAAEGRVDDVHEAMALVGSEDDVVGGGGPAAWCDFEFVAAAALSSLSFVSVRCVATAGRHFARTSDFHELCGKRRGPARIFLRV